MTTSISHIGLLESVVTIIFLIPIIPLLVISVTFDLLYILVALTNAGFGNLVVLSNIVLLLLLVTSYIYDIRFSSITHSIENKSCKASYNKDHEVKRKYGDDKAQYNKTARSELAEEVVVCMTIRNDDENDVHLLCRFVDDGDFKIGQNHKGCPEISGVN